MTLLYNFILIFASISLDPNWRSVLTKPNIASVVFFFFRQQLCAILKSYIGQIPSLLRLVITSRFPVLRNSSRITAYAQHEFLWNFELNQHITGKSPEAHSPPVSKTPCFSPLSKLTNHKRKHFRSREGTNIPMFRLTQTFENLLHLNFLSNYSNRFHANVGSNCLKGRALFPYFCMVHGSVIVAVIVG